MKPKVFIGSSTETEKYAVAIHAQLRSVAECTPWTAGAFGLSEQTIQGLMRNLRESDFGVFIFGADDVATVRGELLSITRDNVIYEAGLFGGYLSPDRCFIVLPDSVGVHLPSDLLGMTVGRYEDNRSDSNDRSAVAPFCDDVKRRIQSDGFFPGTIQEQLRELCTRFDCCQWIKEDSPRAQRKTEVSRDIDEFCRRNKLNKHRLLQQHRPGYYVALLSAIRFLPETSDAEIIRRMKTDTLPSGFIYFKLMDAIEVLKQSGKANILQLTALQSWLRTLPDPNHLITKPIDDLLD